MCSIVQFETVLCIFIHIFSWKLNISSFVKLGTELNIHLSSQEVDIHYFPVEIGHPLFSSQEVDIHYFITRHLVDIHFVSIRKWTSIIFQLGSRHPLFSNQEVDLLNFQLGSGHSFFFQLGSRRPLVSSQEVDLHFFPVENGH